MTSSVCQLEILSSVCGFELELVCFASNTIAIAKNMILLLYVFNYTRLIIDLEKGTYITIEILLILHPLAL
jgi:hypothetical protein